MRKTDFIVLSISLFIVLTYAEASPVSVVDSSNPNLLDRSAFKHYIETFNKNDDQTIVNHIDNNSVWLWLTENIPFFECPDKSLEETYYFRWWTFRKHIKKTPDGFIITEFLPPVSWAGKYNSISCAAGHHLYEGRWIRNPEYLDEYSVFWLRKGGEPRRYSFWAADAIYARYLVNSNKDLIVDLLPELVKNYQEWEKTHRDANGLFWQIDDRDGMEKSIGGSGYRATINSYMYGDVMAIACIAEAAGKTAIADQCRSKAAEIKKLVQEKLWDEKAGFFKVLPRIEGKPAEQLADVRELHGYVPWYFNLPDDKYAVAWQYLMDTNGFYAPFGPTTAERRHPRFMFQDPHECLWNGPSWPYATTQTLVALANVLNNYEQKYITKNDYYKLLAIYTKSHRQQLANGQLIPWIDEDLDPFTGEWLARKILYQRNRPDKDRGKDYNHSGFADLIITGLVGLRPRADDIVKVNPLVPEGTWPYFCLDGVFYHGHCITIIYDKTGRHYNKGAGLRIFDNGKEIATADRLCRVKAKLTSGTQIKSEAIISCETTAGWVKYEKNPVLGGNLGTCFDVSLLREEKTYRMYFSWRPRKSVALVESGDGINWSSPVIVLGPNSATGWEEDINRPVVVKRADGYLMWYTGQAKGQSWLGYARSSDGKIWQRVSDKPVLSPDRPWEKVAVMCPHVIWDDKAKLLRMWYSAGEQYEPDAIGYATSPNGMQWTKWETNPIFRADPQNTWEQHKVTGCQVVYHNGWYYMFYIGFRDVDHAQIGLARSRDGITTWQRHSANPIISPGLNKWDQDACYKPFAVFDGWRWLLWYNGRRGSVEQIGLAIHEGEDLGF